MDSQKEMQEKAFPPDFDKHLYTIEIKVFENVAQLNISWPKKVEGRQSPTINHIIGVLETQKASLILTQTDLVQPAYETWKAREAAKKEENNPETNIAE